MGLDYNITIASGFLLKNITDKKINVADWVFESFNTITDGCVGDINNIFIPGQKIKSFYCGSYEEEWLKDGITNFIGNDEEYDEENIDLYADELLKIYQKNNMPFNIQFCRIPKSDLPEEANIIKIASNEAKNNRIAAMLIGYDDHNQKIIRKLLQHATYGIVMMKAYS